MALILINEDGSGRSDANSYASVADGDAYHDGHLYATAWTAAVLANKEKALAMATRLIDAEYHFHGTRTHDSQALQWPRYKCPDRDNAGLWGGAAFYSSDVIPKALINATCELARELLIADRTAAPAGEGLKYYNDGAVQTGYDKNDRRPIISQVAQAFLNRFGTMIRSWSGAVQLERA